MTYIDAVLFINLEHRKDRLEHIEIEIGKLGLSSDRVHRIDATHHRDGAIGCGLSHVKALEFAMEHPDWQRVLILEDDFTFSDVHPEEVQRRVHELLNFDLTMNVCLLAGNHQHFQFENTSDPLIKRVLNCLTTSGYVIQRSYIPTLRNVFHECMNNALQRGIRHEWCIDVAWSRLQRQDHGWYITVPKIGYQMEGYSDVQNAKVNYRC